jgi:AGZA family xanthine/uracil permease-like MFS transporter
MNEKIDEYFGISRQGSTIEGEIRAGVTTFLTMAYILIVNPKMMSGSDITFMDFETGIPFGDALFATAVAACVACLIMGLWANLPFALAPGMGLNAYFLYGVCLGMGIPWDVALAAVFVEGLLFLGLASTGARAAMINAIPKDLKIATMAGIGLFLAIIGMEEAGWVVDNPATLVDLSATSGWTHMSGELWALIGLLLTAILMARKQKGAIMISIFVVAICGWGLGVTDAYNGTEAAFPDNIVSTPEMPTKTMGAVFGALGDIGGEVGLGTFLMVMIAFFFVDIFDTAGTLYGVGRMAGKIDENDELENANEAFMADAAGTAVGALMGTSTVTTYIESAAGIEEGGKTGLTAVVVGVLFLLGLFFADLFIAIPTFAVAPALIVIGAMMMRGIADIHWNDMEIAIPAFLTISLMPFTYSIADGIAWGVISYVAIKIGVGKYEEILNNRILLAIFVLMAMFYLGPGDQSTFDWILSALN